jgi:hypothetical protein
MLQIFIDSGPAVQYVYLFLGKLIDITYIPSLLFLFAAIVVIFFLLLRYSVGVIKHGK